MLSGLSPRSAVLDVGIGVVALALSLGFGRHAALSQPGTRPLDALGYALVVMSCAAVVARRVAPVPVLGIVAAALVLFAAFNYPGGPLLVPVMVAVYSVGTAVERPAVLALGAVVTAIVAIPLRAGQRWAWWACWAVLIAYLGYTFTFGVHDHAILARSLIGVIALPILLAIQLPTLARRRPH